MLAVIEGVLPPTVASAEAFDDLPDAPLFPEEEELVARAVNGRRRAFATARACARTALGELGVPPVAIPREDSGAPRWPQGVVGSITHCDGYRASAVAWSRDVAAVGIDAEPNKPLPAGVLERIASGEEIARLRELADVDSSVRWDRLAFSAREAAYKAWSPLTGRWLGFDEVAMAIDPQVGTFDVRLKAPGPLLAGRELTGFQGRWLARAGLLVTAVALAVS